MWTVREGGTGTLSEREVQPDFLPDRFEPGSHNAIGLIGLHAAVGWILERGIEAMRRHELGLIEAALAHLTDAQAMPGLRLYGPTDPAQRCGVFSVRIDAEELSRPQVLSDLLESEFGILTRSGVHCAPLAHRTFGTAERGGMTRLSVGPFTTLADIAEACEALGVVCGRYARAAV